MWFCDWRKMSQRFSKIGSSQKWVRERKQNLRWAGKLNSLERIRKLGIDANARNSPRDVYIRSIFSDWFFLLICLSWKSDMWAWYRYLMHFRCFSDWSATNNNLSLDVMMALSPFFRFYAGAISLLYFAADKTFISALIIGCPQRTPWQL